MTRGDLTDDEWRVIEPLLPLGEQGPIPDLRRLVNGVMWRFRTGSPWRDVPELYGPWSSVYGRFHLWARAGVFQALMEAVITEASARGRWSSAWWAWTPRRPGPTTTPPPPG